MYDPRPIEYILTPQVLGITEKEFFDQMGVHFVGFVGQYGYDRVLSVLGRHVRDFLNGLDNLHEYLKFSYPRMRAPSFICENETRQGKYCSCNVNGFSTSLVKGSEQK